MRAAATIVALWALLLPTGFGQVKPRPALEPSALEAFAQRPTARVTWSEEVGRIDSTQARAVITVLEVEDALHPPHPMRGVRIDLQNEHASDQVYLDETKLEPVKKALEEIARHVEPVEHEPGGAPLRYHGAAEFRQLHSRVHTLSAAYYVDDASDSSGLSLSAHKEEEFRFPDHSPSELAAALGRAMEKLKER